MGLAARGLMNKQIAGEVGTSEITVKIHRGNAMRKMEARTFADLVRMAEALGPAHKCIAAAGGGPQSFRPSASHPCGVSLTYSFSFWVCSPSTVRPRTGTLP
jgi:hypothetical protein